MKRRLEITSQKRAIPNQAMLHEAVKSNDKCTVEQILATNSDGAFLTDEAFDPFNPGRVRPFVIAIRENKDEIVAIFLRFPNAVTATDIANAIYCDKLEIIGPWIDGIIGKHPKNFCDEQLDVLLSAAVGSNKIGAVKFIISKYPVNINMSHLIIAIDSHHLEMFSFLLILGAKIDDKDHRNYRLLECAIYHKETAALELVLRSGANVNIQDKQRWTVLHRVVDRVDVDKVRLLLKYNADVYIKNNRGSTPQDIVWNKIQNGQGGTRENRDIVHQLLSEAMDSQKKIESNNYYQGMLREPVNNFQHTSGIIDLTDANVTKLKRPNENLNANALVKTNQLQTKVFNQSSQPHIAIPSNMVGKIPTLPHAPLQKTTKQNIGTALYKTLAFTSANALLRNNDNTKPCLEYSISYFKSKVILITKEAIKNTDKPVFILAGKGKDSLVPDIKTISSTKKRNKYLFITNKHNAKSLASNIKIILVFTRAEYAAITGLPEGTSVLVIDTLNSHTHGLVKEEHHGTINSRRIAAFIGCEFLHRQYKVTTAIMMNDNIDSVKFQVKFGMQNNLEHDWDQFYNSLTTNMIDNNSVCISVATMNPFNNKNKQSQETQENKLGSKIFLLDLNKIFDSIIGRHQDGCFLPFPPATHNQMMLEYYYMQLIFHAIFHKKSDGGNIGAKGYVVAANAEFELSNVKQNHNSHPTDKTNILTELSKSLNFYQKEINNNIFYDFNFYPPVESSCNRLKGIVDKKIESNKAKLQRVAVANLPILHAKANKITLPRNKDIVSSNEPDNFLVSYKDKIDKFLDGELSNLSNQNLRLYQKDALSKISAEIKQDKSDTSKMLEKLFGEFSLATGTGKTYVQIYLATLAMLTGTNKPFIIVTPTIDLVSQFYDDFIKVLTTLNNPISQEIILQVDSEQQSVSLDTLLINQDLVSRQKILIICKASFIKMLNHTGNEHYTKPCMLAIDESAKFSAEDAERIKTKMDSYIVTTFSATPKRNIQTIAGNSKSFEFRYTRTQGVIDKILSPFCLYKFPEKHTVDDVKAKISKMGDFLNSHYHPNGKTLVNYKGIIYVPNKVAGYDYSAQLSDALDAVKIGYYRVDAEQTDRFINMDNFKNNADMKKKILICKGMARLGFSDTQISWTIYLRNGDAADVAQVAGRTVRYLGGKIGYMLAFDNVQAELLELNGTNYDAAAADLIDGKYKEQLQPKRVKNTPAGILNSYNNVFNITINNIFNNESTQQAKTPQGQMKTFTNYCNDIENKQDPDAIHFPENYDFNQQNLGNWTLLFE